MKGLILSGGYGTRLRPITYSQQKQLIPVANKPILFYAIEDMIDAGIKEIGIVVGPNKEQVIETVRSKNWDASVEFIYQGEPKGIAHAILVSEKFLGNDNFVLYLGDNILMGGITTQAKKFLESGNDSDIMLTEVDNPSQFGVAELNSDGSIKKLVEKPKNPQSNLALIGVYFYKPVILKACRSIMPSWRNELEMTDAIQWLIENGYKVGCSLVEGWWKDTGRPEDILEANRLVLDKIDNKNSGKMISSRVNGKVIIDPGAEIINSDIEGPCIIGSGSLLVNCSIGKHTSIGKNCVIENAEIENSMVMDKSRIMLRGKIKESLIGREVKIIRKGELPGENRFLLGDQSELVE